MLRIRAVYLGEKAINSSNDDVTIQQGEAPRQLRSVANLIDTPSRFVFHRPNRVFLPTGTR